MQFNSNITISAILYDSYIILHLNNLPSIAFASVSAYPTKLQTRHFSVVVAAHSCNIREVKNFIFQKEKITSEDEESTILSFNEVALSSCPERRFSIS